MIWPGCKLFSRASPPGPHKSFRRLFFQESKLCETCPRIRQVSWPIDIPIIIDAFLLLNIQIRTSSSGYVNVFEWKKGMMLLSASKVWLWVQRDDGIWSFLTWTESHLSLHRHPETSLEVVEETLLILQENPCDFLLEMVAEKINSPFSTGNITSFALRLFE